MVYEQVMSHRQLKPGPAGPLGAIVIIEESQSKPLIEPPNRIVNSPFHEQAESRQLGYGEPLSAMLVAPTSSEALHFINVGIWHVVDELRRGGIVRHGANQPDLGSWLRGLELDGRAGIRGVRGARNCMRQELIAGATNDNRPSAVRVDHGEIGTPAITLDIRLRVQMPPPLWGRLGWGGALGAGIDY